RSSAGRPPWSTSVAGSGSNTCPTRLLRRRASSSARSSRSSRGPGGPPTPPRVGGGPLGELERAWGPHDLPWPRVVLEPGRSLVGPAGLTLYRVGVVKRASEKTTYGAVDGGMSDTPPP